jgi:hypothetical protein
MYTHEEAQYLIDNYSAKIIGQKAASGDIFTEILLHERNGKFHVRCHITPSAFCTLGAATTEFQLASPEETLKFFNTLG